MIYDGRNAITLSEARRRAGEILASDGGRGMSARVAVLPVPVNYDCPDWCERSDHDADVVGPNDPPSHYGPEFGRVWVQAVGGGPLLAEVDPEIEQDEFDASGLRKLAADVLAAAEWIEAHQ